MRDTLRAFLLCVTICSSAWCDELQAVTEARLQAAYAEARQALATHLGTKLEQFPPLQISNQKAVSKAIAKENLPVIQAHEPDERKAKMLAAQAGAQYAQILFAKYSWSAKELLVLPGNWEANARLLQRPALTGDQALKAVMVHELCHALDDQEYGIARLLASSPSTDGISAVNALIEGHAQLRARQVCQAAGWSEGFEVFTGAVGLIPESSQQDGELLLQMLRAQSAELSLTYHDGERFVKAIQLAAGEEGVRKLFQEPPQDTDVILNPGWYLDPKSRPVARYESAEVLNTFESGFNLKEWTAQRLLLNRRQMAAALTLLPKEESDQIVRSLVINRVIVLQPTLAPASKLAQCAFFEFDSEQSAQNFLASSRKLSALKDQQMSSGTAKIQQSVSTELQSANLRGWLHEKQIEYAGTIIQVAAADVQLGPVVIETIFSVHPIEREAHQQLLEQLLEQVKPK